MMIIIIIIISSSSFIIIIIIIIVIILSRAHRHTGRRLATTSHPPRPPEPCRHAYTARRFSVPETTAKRNGRCS